MKYSHFYRGLCACLIWLCIAGVSFAQNGPGNLSAVAGKDSAKLDASNDRARDSVDAALEKTVKDLMKTGNIPGLSLILVRDGQTTIKSYGYADLDSKRPVTERTLFELGSCSKAFTALAAARLIHEKVLRMDDSVSRFLPWFSVTFKGAPVQVTIAQLLHHTSGIPWSTISEIPQTNSPDALERTVRTLAGQELKHRPGKKYEYATINYDVLALIIQQVTGMPFERYITQAILSPLQLRSTTIGYPADRSLKATGYKIGFFQPRAFQAPVFAGNNAAGYVISNAGDMAEWLQFQMGMTDTGYYSLAIFTQQRDESVPLHGMASYAMGWEVALDGTGEVYHGGVNPNYTSYIVMRKKSRLGVVVLTNSNSTYTPLVAMRVMHLLAGEKIEKEFDPGDGNDKLFSITSILLGMYAGVMLFFLGSVLVAIRQKRRIYSGFTRAGLGRIGLLLLLTLPFAYGLYKLPDALFGFSWQAMIVWTPVSLLVALGLLIAAVILSIGAYVLCMAYPEPDKFRRILPRLVLISVLSGLSNMLLIVWVTSSLDSKVELDYQVFYYLLTLSVYLFGRRFVQVNLIKFGMQVVYDLRIRIMEKIFATTFQKFELIDRGRVYTAMNDDVNIIGDSSNSFVVLVTSAFTAAGAILYLASIAFWATILTFALILILVSLYYFVSKSTNQYYESARDSRNGFMKLINGMIDGYKELSLHRNKKNEFKEEVAASAGEYRNKMTAANIRYVNASFVGEAVLVVILGVVAFGFPKLFPGIQNYTLMSFIIVLLYLIGPVNVILNAIPVVARFRIALRRVRGFLGSIPAGSVNRGALLPSHAVPARIGHLKVNDLHFQYPGQEEAESFSIGPIDLELNAGEIVFIVGGNGSGKTTFAKLLTGLYEPDKGSFMIDGQVIKHGELGEYFSTVFSPMYLFDRLYNIDVKEKTAAIQHYLGLLHLDHKVKIKGNKYSTTHLSGGQRKRLALLQCYLEDAPVCLFDEWAADQDPAYRYFFYRTLLPQMKKSGKMIIAITHDDHYFDVADRVYKMDQGRLSPWESSKPVFETSGNI